MPSQPSPAQRKAGGRPVRLGSTSIDWGKLKDAPSDAMEHVRQVYGRYVLGGFFPFFFCGAAACCRCRCWVSCCC